MTIKFGIKSKNELIQYIVAFSIELIFGIIPFFPLNKRVIKKHSEYVQGIGRIVDNEISEVKRKAK